MEMAKFNVINIKNSQLDFIQKSTGAKQKLTIIFAHFQFCVVATATITMNRKCVSKNSCNFCPS
jgi:hypothetical protein